MVAPGNRHDRGLASASEQAQERQHRNFRIVEAGEDVGGRSCSVDTLKLGLKGCDQDVHERRPRINNC